LKSVDWKQKNGISALCNLLEVREDVYRRSRAAINTAYIEKPIIDPKSGKPRDLCYPAPLSALRMIQERIKDRILRDLELLEQVRGYRSGSHNINSAGVVSGHKFVGKVDIRKFHPSITPRHISTALVEHGLSPSWAREIARMVSYKGRLPQGACTSNHIANLVINSLLRRDILQFVHNHSCECCNFGDDIAFFGDEPHTVRACVRHAKLAVAKLGFVTNEKCRDCEHRGGRRLFIGCATGRDKPDYPRDKYRAFRKELRATLHAELSSCDDQPVTTPQQLNSFKHRIAYVERLNKKKARSLLKIFYRICHARRRVMAS
jgi:hypothetical protein